MLIKFNFSFKYCYYNNNLKRHRLNAPTLESKSGSKAWAINGSWHREGGAAMEWDDGAKYYYLNGEVYSEKEYWQIIRFGGFV